MFRVSIALLLALFLAVPVGAAEVDSDSVYCFSDSDFSQEPLAGICITGLPDPQTGTVMLGSRVLQKGDILAADQIAQMTFLPLPTQEDTVAQVSYLPIYENRVEKNCVMTISIRGKTDEVPVAEDSSVETYKNLTNEGKVQASDPEGKELTSEGFAQKLKEVSPNGGRWSCGRTVPSPTHPGTTRSGWTPLPLQPQTLPGMSPGRQR